MLGDARTHARTISELAALSGAAFVVSEYTRTPEARHPVALEESYAVLTWLADHRHGPDHAGRGGSPSKPVTDHVVRHRSAKRGDFRRWTRR